MNYVICHYSEIGLKGKNRRFFEKKLVFNIERALKKDSFKKVERKRGRIVVELTTKAKKEEVERALKKVFGIAYFSFAYKTESDIEKIKELAGRALSEKKEEVASFRVTTKRGDKSFPSTSVKINREVGAFIVNHFGWNVNLEDFDLNLFIEVTEKGSFLYFDKIRGYGGLPVSSSGRAALLLSGGIDSPVAAFKMMKRGLLLDFVHFHAYPTVSKASINKAKKLFSILKEYSPESRLILIPFGEVQKKIRLEVPESLRIIFYRRLMLQIAEKVADNLNAEALVTGESLGQVSSQTMSNIAVTDRAVDLPILRPLIGENKGEIMEIAREIGTYPVSILPDEDCCTLFNPRSPDTGTNLKRVIEVEKGLDIEKEKSNCIKNKEVLT